MSQLLAMVVNERQDIWNAQLSHAEFAQKNSFCAATGLVPNGVHIGWLSHPPLTIFDRSGVTGYQGLVFDHLAYCDLRLDRQQHANDVFREIHYLTVSRVER